MKKLLLLLLPLFCFCSKISDDELQSNALTKQSIEDRNEFYVSNKEAKIFAEMNRRTKEFTKEIENIEFYIDRGDTLLYVVNFKDDKGWIIIPSDKRIQAILSNSDSGNFLLESLIPPVKYWLEEIANSVKYYRTNSFKENMIETVWKTVDLIANYKVNTKSSNWQIIVVHDYVLIFKGPLIETKWGQDYPWNTCVPYNSIYTTERVPTGCVAVSGAQMAYYLYHLIGYPEASYEIGTCNGNIYNYTFSFSNLCYSTWGQMSKNYNDNTKSFAYVGNLMGYIGKKINMQYGNTQSGAYTSDLPIYFEENDILSNYNSYSSSTAESNIYNNKPIIVRASSNSDGHSWIIDGYTRLISRYTSYLIYQDPTEDNPLPELTDDMIIDVTSSIVSKYFFMNWGWDGAFDLAGYSYDSDWLVGVHNFNYQRQMLHNFRKK